MNLIRNMCSEITLLKRTATIPSGQGVTKELRDQDEPGDPLCYNHM